MRAATKDTWSNVLTGACVVAGFALGMMVIPSQLSAEPEETADAPSDSRAHDPEPETEDVAFDPATLFELPPWEEQLAARQHTRFGAATLTREAVWEARAVPGVPERPEGCVDMRLGIENSSTGFAIGPATEPPFAVSGIPVDQSFRLDDGRLHYVGRNDIERDGVAVFVDRPGLTVSTEWPDGTSDSTESDGPAAILFGGASTYDAINNTAPSLTIEARDDTGEVVWTIESTPRREHPCP